MDVGSKALLHFALIITLWTILPLLPAWITYRITPDQNLGLKGPFQGMTLKATGAFVAYLVVASLLSIFAWPIGNLLIGKEASDSMWKITGRATIFDSEGKLATQLPDLRTAYLRVLPDQNVIDTDLSINVPFPRDGKPTVYVEVPNWGGAKISLNDTESYKVDSLSRKITLKDPVQFRQLPKARLAVGESQ